MEIITLVGESDSGKTTVLKTLIFRMLDAGGQLNYSKPKYAKRNNFLSNDNKDQLAQELRQELKSPLTGKPEKDITAKFDYNGKTVLITTVGDTVEYIANAYEKNQPCDVFVCASHNTKTIVTYLKSLGNVSFVPQAKIQSIDDPNAFEKAISERNKHVCQHLFRMI